jgi:hypothetical protein
MSKLGILAATALSLSLAVATPALAGGHGWGGGGMHGGGMHFSGGAAAFHGASPAFAGHAFRGAQASMAAGPTVSGGNFARAGSAQFAQGGYQRGFRGDHDHRGFGRGLGFVAGLAAGSALGYGYYDSYPYDDYAYNDYYGGGYSDGYVVSSPGYVVSGGGASDPAYCAQRYRSYDPATGTYLGYDGLRHPCE